VWQLRRERRREGKILAAITERGRTTGGGKEGGKLGAVEAVRFVDAVRNEGGMEGGKEEREGRRLMTYSGHMNGKQDAANIRSCCHFPLAEGPGGRVDTRGKTWICVRTKHRLLLVDVWSREVGREGGREGR